MEKQTIRIRRVGSFTFGIVMIAVGILFLLNLFFRELNCIMILRFWPIILILLGIEVLLGCRAKTWEVVDPAGRVIEQSKIVYDVPAIILTMVLIGFAFCMAVLNWMCVNGPMHLTF